MKRLSDPYLMGVALFSLVAIVGWVIEGAVDQGIFDFRETILIGLLIGLLSRLSMNQKNWE